MSDLILARDLVVILITAFFGGVVAKKLRLPLLIGYLGSGVLINSLFGSLLGDGLAIRNIAEIGVALLLFTLGLEFSLQKLKEFSDVIIYGSFIQIVLTTLMGVVIFPFFGFDFWISLFLAASFSLSSTAVVVKSLFDRGELETLHGEVAAGWLFMQDLFTLPMMILLPTVGQIMKEGKVGWELTGELSTNILFAVSSFFVIIILGKQVIPRLIESVAGLKSRELTLVISVVICLVFAFLFKLLGFSFAIGAFVAGVLISSSSAYHGIFAEVRPLRDLFSVVFFVSLGFLISPSFFLANLPVILSLSLIIILLKLFISLIILLFLGFHTKPAALISISLVSVGEFAFILALGAVTSKLIKIEDYMLIVTVSFVTLIISVPLISASQKLYSTLRHLLKKRVPYLTKFIDSLDKKQWITDTELHDHVVVLGHGRVGKYICRALSFVEVPFIVVDYDHSVVKKLKNEGINVIYGDPADLDVLNFAKVNCAKVIIIAYSDRHMMEVVITNIMTINPNIKIICRIHHEEDLKKLKSLGAEIVIQPEFEAAIAITEKLLPLFGVADAEISGKIKRLKIEHGI